MKYIFLLSGDHTDLAKEEVISLFKVRKYDLLDRVLIVDFGNDIKLNNKTINRLALTKSIYKFLFECEIDKLVDFMKKFDWNSVYRDNFCLRIHYFKDTLVKNKKLSEKELAKYIWHSVKNPKVDLKNPKTKIEIFVVKNIAYCGLLVYENKENFESRKAHLRPFPHPGSLHPKLARAFVNLTGVKENETLLDPFCGTGGFLIEGGLMNLKVVGYDIIKNMVKGCKDNLKHFNIKNFKIVNKNALKINKKFNCIVTDLPYGLNSNVYLQYYKNTLKQKNNKINLKISKKDAINNLEKFYLKFLKKSRKKLKKNAVIIFPHYVDYKNLIKAAKLKIEKEFSIYVHRSLIRKIVLLRNQ